MVALGWGLGCAVDLPPGEARTAAGAKPGAKKTLAEAVAWAKKLPKSQVSAKRLAALEAKLAGK